MLVGSRVPADGPPRRLRTAVGGTTWPSRSWGRRHFAVTPEEYIKKGATVAAVVRYTGTGKATGKALDLPFVHTSDFRDGKRARFDTVKFAEVVPVVSRGCLTAPLRPGRRPSPRTRALAARAGFTQLAAWQSHRVLLPPGPLFCVIDGQTRGRRWAATAARGELRDLAAAAGFRRRFAPHQLRHAHAVELAREGVAVNIIQRQLGHTDLGTTSTYLQGIDPIEIIDTVRTRHPPTIPMTAGLDL